MAKAKKKQHVFYAWQSDSPKKTNLFAIRSSIKSACKEVSETAPQLHLIPDEATRDESGSPNIALKIIEKIQRSSIFVADITTITSSSFHPPSPNPNVVFELGFAVAELGWERIILLTNTAFSSFPSDLPFDIIQNRVSPYDLSLDDPASKKKVLTALLTEAISLVISKNPKRPAELRGLQRETIEHQSDVKNIRWLLRRLHLPTLQDHIEELPRLITERALYFYESVRGVITSPVFNIYDPIVSQALEKLSASWQRAIAHDNEYHDAPGGQMHIFTNPGDGNLAPRRQEIWNQIMAAREEMAESSLDLLERIRSAYFEIDVMKTNKSAWKDYVAFIRSTDKLLKRDKRRQRKRK